MVVFCIGIVQAQAVFTVSNTDDTGAGSLRQAIADASSGDTIAFNLSNPSVIILYSEILIDKNLIVKAPTTNSVIISGSSTRLFSVASNATLVLQRLTLSNGIVSNGNGGAIDNSGTLYLQFVTINNCSASFGGAIYNASQAFLHDCSLTSNDAGSDGGAIHNNGTLYIKRSTLSDNTATNGGAVNNYSQLICDSSYLDYNTVYGGGGGLTTAFGTANITNSSISYNVSPGDGGGIYHYQGTLKLRNVDVSGNNANGILTRGGGIFCNGNGSTTIEISKVENNYSIVGAGIFVNDGNLRMDTSSISNNDASTSAGGILITADGEAFINACSFKSNDAQIGSALSNLGVSSVYHSTFSNNSANDKGGALFNMENLTVSRTTFSGNMAVNSGGALENEGSATISNCTFHQNNGTSGIGINNIGTSVINVSSSLFSNSSLQHDGTVTSGGYNFSNDATFSFSATGDRNSVSNLNLGTLQNNGGATHTHALLSCSDAIEAGAAADNGNDQRGEEIFGDYIDIGAYEYQGLGIPAIPVISQSSRCAGDVVSTISNYNAAFTYTFTPAGPTVNGIGTVVDAVLETAYTITASDGTCTSPSSASFENETAFTLNVLAFTGAGSSLMAEEADADYQWLDCSNNYAIIPDATEQLFIVGMSGNYAVEITKGACKDTSICTLVNSITQEQAQQLFSMYPNPAQHEIVLQGTSKIADQLFRIVDVFGNTVLTGTLTSEAQTVSVRNIAAGVYTMHVGTANQKLVIQH